MPQDSFAEVFSRAVAERGLTLERLHERLVQAAVPVSIATLSYWQSGRSTPERRSSLKALPVLEGVLGLAPGQLTRHLPVTPKRRGRAAAAPPMPGMEAVVPAGETVARIIADWGIGMEGRLARMSVQDRLAVTDEGTDGPINTRQVLRAEVDGVESFPVIYVQDVEGPAGSELLPPLSGTDDQPDATNQSDIVALTACRVGRVERVRDVNLLVAELVLPHPLAKGEVIMTEHLLLPAPMTNLADRIQRGIQRPLRELVLEAHFDPSMVPARAFRFVREVVDGPEVEIEQVPVHGSTVQTIFLDLRCGTAGLRWDWE